MDESSSGLGSDNAGDPMRDPSINDMMAYLPSHSYIYTPTNELWPASSVNSRFESPLAPDGGRLRPSEWLDKFRAVEQMVWDPNEPRLIADRVMLESGYLRHCH